jgi:hypothetical protein
MYKGDTPPEGWYLYDIPTNLKDVIYITNIQGSTPSRYNV